LKSKSIELNGLQTIAKELDALSEKIRKSESVLDITDIDAHLTEIEKHMLSVLISAAGQNSVTEIEKQVRADLGNRRGQMRDKDFRDVENQAVFKQLLELFGLPRLSLFYMDAGERARIQ
jgi:hypothetical protein